MEDHANENPLTCVFYVEISGKSEGEIESREELIRGRFEANPKIELLRTDRAGVVEVGRHEFVDTLELEIRGDLESILTLALEYRPSVVEVLSPPSIGMNADELSSLMMTLSSQLRRIGSGEVEIGNLEELPLPPLGYEEEEVAELVYENRQIFYRMQFETPRGREATIKTLTVLGCGIDRINFREGRNINKVEVTLVSPFDSLMAATAFYRPKRVEILDPGFVDITALEIQNGLMDTIGIVRISLMEQ